MLTCLCCGKQETEKMLLTDIVYFKKIVSANRCQMCHSKLVRLANEPTCLGCCRIKQDENDSCLDCVKWKQLYPKYAFSHTALFQYNLFLKEWLENFKYKGDYRLAKLFNQELTEYFNMKNQKNKQYIPIPISQTSMKLRGFNQVEELLASAGIPFHPALIHVGTGEKQSSKNRKERMESKQPFKLDENYCSQLKNQQIILIDDVYTTGRTLFHAAELLQQIGVATIETFSIAR
ncbi:competence protein ComFC [Carnobacterium iners]|uniref:Competence protein ComFC n=1 Tax=Carnobacterium iners TaxID=1073423 RepID=A0A1X7MQ17_9LACT|nr:ComF family protein [Carnobacterium iners]SEL25431.1 competence protein ComFC [Carnobacterium iners]SMH26900.1 competence protein ComFC [Carnobacterium iners]